MKKIIAYASNPPHQVYILFLRFGLAATAFSCLSVATNLWASGDMVQQKLSVIFAFANYAIAFFLIFLSTRKSIPDRFVWAIILGLMFVLASRIHIHSVNQAMAGTGSATTDVVLFSDYAAKLIQLGENPYSKDLIDAFRVYRRSTVFNTPLIDGDFTARVAYPPLAVLIFIPFQVLGLSSDLVYVVFLIIVYLLMFYASPKLFRPLILLPFFTDPDYINYSLGGVNDIVWACLLVLMILVWDRMKWRGIIYGLACAFKQTPWLLAPFLLIRIWQSSHKSPKERLNELIQFAGYSLIPFLLINGPFILLDLNGWFSGVMEPFVTDMIFYGQGLSSLTMLGYLIIPKSVYTFMVLSIYISAIILYWLNFEQWPESMWFVPGLVLWFGHRSLTSYWYFFMFPFWISLIRNFDVIQKIPPDRPETFIKKKRLSIAILVIVPLSILIVTTLSTLNKQDQIVITSVPPYYTDGDQVARITVSVSNNSSQILTPRFSVQNSARQPFFWHIDSGPLLISPNESALYQISTNIPFETFNLKHGAQIIVSDANSYDLRGSTTIKGEVAARHFDGIPNGEYKYWGGHTNAVYFWGNIIDPPQPNNFELVYDNDFEDYVLQLALSETNQENWSLAMLDVWINFPESDVQLWVKPPQAANHIDNLDIAYGLEVFSTGMPERVWILFGDEFSYGQLEPNLYYWMIPAPRETWSQQTFNLKSIYETLNLEIAPRQQLIRHNQEFPVSMLNFRLLLASQPTNHLPLQAVFGPVKTLHLEQDFTSLVEEGLNDPKEALIWRAQYNFDARNFEKARDYYLEAYDIQSDDDRVLYGLAETYFWLGEYQNAISFFEQSIDVSYRVAESYRGIGWSEFVLGDFDKAESAFQMTLKIDPNLADAHNGLGHVWIEREQCDLAIPELQLALQLLPGLNNARTALEYCSSN